jgi:hypothetical protein
MRARATLTSLVTVAMLVANVGRAAAAHLEKTDEHIVKDASPAQSQEPGQSLCNASSFQTGSFTSGQNFASAEEATGATVDSEDPTCMAAAEADISASVTITIVADPGDAPGTPIPLCLAADLALFAQDSGAAEGHALLGGFSSLVTPATVVRNPGAVTLFSEGPLNLRNDSSNHNQLGEFTANIGDTLTIELGNESSGIVSGIGSSTASTNSKIKISIGACGPLGAPAMSGSGLAALAVGLAGLGAGLLRRRIRRH